MLSRPRLTGLAAILVMAYAMSAPAATITVQPDGSGDTTTIAAAIDLADDGDVILVGNGTYTENLMVDKDLVIRGEESAEFSILDGEHSHGLMLVQDGSNVTLANLTFTQASLPQNTGHGGALLIWDGSRAEISDCVFIDNYSGWDNGGLHVRGVDTQVLVSRCLFIDNRAVHNGGACGVGAQAQLTIEDCLFDGNSCDTITGAVNAYAADRLEIRWSVFAGNAAAVGAVLVENTYAELVGNTFYANTSTDHGSVLYYSGSSGIFQSNIVAGDTEGVGLKVLDGTCTHTCNIYKSNTLGPVAGDDLQTNEWVIDPLFCAPGLGDFSLCIDSPALPANNPCGPIGAMGHGCDECGTVTVETRSWSAVKRRFR